MKQRFSSLDVKVMAHELAQNIVSLRLSNIYDLSSKIMLFKFAKPDNKKQLVVDSGFRCHLTDFARTTSSSLSPFVVRLRKFIKTRRLTAVSQVGTDRVLEFQFSDGLFRLYLEFFAGGNVILTDAKHTILVILRNVPEGEAQEPQRVGLQYSIHDRQNYRGVPPLTRERVKEALQSSIERAAKEAAAGKRAPVKPGEALRRSVALGINELPPMLFEHAFNVTEFDATLSPHQVLGSNDKMEHLLQALARAREILDEITKTPSCPGYIFAKKRPGAEVTLPTAAEESEPKPESKRQGFIYDDYGPFLPRKLESNPSIHVLKFDTFNKAVDEYFSSVEGQKLESRLAERELTAQRKLEATRRDQASRVEGLQEAQLLNIRKAGAIEANIERVGEAMEAIGGLLEQGMDWVDIGKLVEREQKRGNTVAQTIKLPMRLAENTITLLLGEGTTQEEEEADEADETDEEESDDDEGSQSRGGKAAAADKRLEVDINITISPWSNAREYYDQKRTAAVKQARTMQQSEIALRNAEKKITSELKKGLAQEKALMHAIRKPAWFEKFHWFISSDGYLVLGGRDAAQNEMLYRRHLRKGDIYCHADLHGAASVVIKNNASTPDAPIPPSTLSQAGSLCVCSSSAWGSKAAMGAWWVNADQVSKSAPEGEFLPVGSFLVRGKKNFLPPAQLLVGLGVMFKISEESKANHVKHRLGGEDAELETGESGPAKEAESNEARPGPLSREDDAGIRSGSDDGGDVSDDEELSETERGNPLQPGGGRADEEPDAEETLKQVGSLSLEEEEEATPGKSDDAEKEAQVEQEEVEEEEVHEDDDKETAEDETGPREEETKATAPSVTTPSSSYRPQPAPIKKLQSKKMSKAKAKKMAKYKDQDEEDRAAFEALTGAKAGRERAEAIAQEKAKKEAELAAQQARRNVQRAKQQKTTARHEEIRRRVMMEAEGIEVLDADEAEKATALDTLVGTPMPGDEILEVVPVCAPWGALGRCKYKAKMQPGQLKKGKAVKEVLDRWRAGASKKGAVDEAARDGERMWPREVELLRTLRPEEVVNCVPVSKVRVMMSGGAGGGGGGGGGKGGGGSGKGGGNAKAGKGKGKR